MSRPFSRIVDNQESSSGSRVTRAGSGTGNGAGVGAGVRDWWRNSRGADGRRESLGSTESIPKSPSQGNEMISVSSNFAGLSPIIAPEFYHTSTSNSPVSPRSQPSSALERTQPPVQSSIVPLEWPQPVAVRSEMTGAGSTVMVEVSQAQAQARGPVDAEAQHTVRTEEGKWWWQRGSLKGLQPKLVICLIAGIFLVITLAIYLGLALANDLKLRREWHVLLILIILVATMVFCHSLVQLCIIATNPLRTQRTSRNFSRIPSVSGPDGYANPREPIRIQTNFEHDVNGIEPDLTKIPPPVYGLWRCSVRVNPDQFYWVRRMSAQQTAIPEGREAISPTSGRVIPRPPSYTSDDGVSYALDTSNPFPPTRPDLPLPPHPSEVRRI